MMPLKYPLAMAAGCVALSVTTIGSLNFGSKVLAQNSPFFESDRLRLTTNNINPVVAQGNFNSEPSGREQIENTRWNQFTAPDKGIPGRREGGGTRGPSLTALVPPTLMGLTLSARPTFHYYISAPLKNSTAEFELTDEDDNTIYRTTFNMNTPEAGIFSITIPESETAPLLDVGKTYRLYLTVKNSDGSFLDYVDGWVKRVELSPNLMRELETAGLEERLGIYEGEAIWYDTLAALAQLRRSNPNEEEVELKWNQLLKEVNLDPLAQQPFVQSQLVSE